MNDRDIALLAQGVLMCRYRVDRASAQLLLSSMAAEGDTSPFKVAAGLITEHERAVGTGGDTLLTPALADRAETATSPATVTTPESPA